MEEGINKFRAKMLKTWVPFGNKGDIVTVCYWYPDESRAVNDKSDFVHFPDNEKYPTNCIDASAMQFIEWLYEDELQ